MVTYFLIAACIFGLAIGSFLNVCIYRVPRKISVGRPVRSFCPECEKQLTWIENIPLVSWLAQRGKCQNCSTKIPFRYPFVEALSMVAAISSYICFRESLTAILVYIILATLIVITFIDLDFKIIPNRITYPGMIIGFIIGLISEFYSPFIWPITTGIIDSLIGFAIGGGFFLSIGWVYYLFTKKVGLGGGDVKLMAMLGAVLGWQSIFPTIFLGSLFGSVIGIFIIYGQKGGRHAEIPFGPWLALGAVIYIFWNPQIFAF